jgi:hypothetical protein
MGNKNTDIWIEADENDLLIEVLLEDHEDIDVVMEGTILFNPSVEIDPLIKDYLEHPNDLTVIYMGAGPITANSYTHTQGIGSDTWNINHNLNRAGVVIQCFDNNKVEVMAEIQHIDNNNSIIRFGLVMSGTAECR